MSELTIDQLTLEQCVQLTGYTPSPCFSIPESQRPAQQLSQARAYVQNRITRGELSLADLQAVAA